MDADKNAGRRMYEYYSARAREIGNPDLPRWADLEEVTREQWQSAAVGGGLGDHWKCGGW